MWGVLRVLVRLLLLDSLSVCLYNVTVAAIIYLASRELILLAIFQFAREVGWRTFEFCRQPVVILTVLDVSSRSCWIVGKADFTLLDDTANTHEGLS